MWIHDRLTLGLIPSGLTRWLRHKKLAGAGFSQPSRDVQIRSVQRGAFSPTTFSMTGWFCLMPEYLFWGLGFDWALLRGLGMEGSRVMDLTLTAAVLAKTCLGCESVGIWGTSMHRRNKSPTVCGDHFHFLTMHHPLGALAPKTPRQDPNDEHHPMEPCRPTTRK